MKDIRELQSAQGKVDLFVDTKLNYSTCQKIVTVYEGGGLDFVATWVKQHHNITLLLFKFRIYLEGIIITKWSCL